MCLSLSYFHNRRDKLLQECVFQQGWPVVVEKVDEQTFDMGAILILRQDNKYYNYFQSINLSYGSCETVSVRQVT